jgi:hypothetical protein
MKNQPNQFVSGSFSVRDLVRDSREARTWSGIAASRLAADRRHRERKSFAHESDDIIRQQKDLFTMALELFTKKFMETASGMYRRAVATELNKMGEFFEEKREERNERLPLVGL